MVTAEPPDPPDIAETDVPTAGNRQSGVLGNERLTGLAGAILLVLFVVEIITVVPLRSLISAHFFVGVLLVGPVTIKTASTGWRFIRYYTRHPAYRRKGPPHPVLRALAPLLVLSTLAVIASGIALAATGPAPLILLRIHVLSFLVWLPTVIVHVVAYLPQMLRLIAEDWRRHPSHLTAGEVGQPSSSGRRARRAVNAAALVASAVAAVLLLPAATPWVGWLGQSVAGPGVVAVSMITVVVVAVTIRRRVRRRGGGTRAPRPHPNHPSGRPPARA